MGSQPSPPTLDTQASQRLTRADYELKEEFAPRLAQAAGAASRSEYRRNLQYGLRTLGDASLRQRYEAAMPEETARRNQLLSFMDAGASPTSEYTRLQSQLQQSVGERAGMLSAEQQREAVQGARAAMSARGLATSSAGSAAEILNRDRYMQQRRALDLGILGQSAALADQERGRQLGLRSDAYNFAMSSNPNVMAIGAGSPYANVTPNALGLMGNQNVQSIYSGGSAGTAGQNMMLAGTLGGGALAAGGMVAGAVII